MAHKKKHKHHHGHGFQSKHHLHHGKHGHSMYGGSDVHMSNHGGTPSPNTGKQHRGEAMHLKSHKGGDAIAHESHHVHNMDHGMPDGYMPAEGYQGGMGEGFGPGNECVD